MLNLQYIKGTIPDSVYNKLPEIVEKYNVNTILRMSHFLSQCSHESQGFKVTEENLYYSVNGLLKIFPKYFTKETAKLYAKQPIKIANKVYSNRMGNGDIESNEGYKFRGRGFLQTTGKNNYIELSKYFDIDFVENPDLVSKEYPLLSAVFYFKKNNLFSLCDKGSTIKDITVVTRAINGGLHGIDQRIKLFNFFFKLLNK
jgi:putative chitinase